MHDLLLRLVDQIAVTPALAAEGGVDRVERAALRTVHEDPVQGVEEVVAGGAVHRPIDGQPLAVPEDLLYDEVERPGLHPPCRLQARGDPGFGLALRRLGCAGPAGAGYLVRGGRVRLWRRFRHGGSSDGGTAGDRRAGLQPPEVGVWVEQAVDV